MPGLETATHDVGLAKLGSAFIERCLLGGEFSLRFFRQPHPLFGHYEPSGFVIHSPGR